MKRNEWIYATPAQLAYIRRLLDKARQIDPVRPPIPYIIDLRRSWLKSEASRAIDHLQESIAAYETDQTVLANRANRD